MRGDSIAVVCGIDEARDKEQDWASITLSSQERGIRALDGYK